MNPPLTKQYLRKHFRELRNKLTADMLDTASKAICAHFFEHFSIKNMRALHIFLSIPQAGEIDTQPIIKRCRDEFPTLSLIVPVIKRGMMELETRLFPTDANLVINEWGIPEPINTPDYPPEMIDLVIIPLLCFDERGFRVGYGKGFYDRFLARCRPTVCKVGISYFPPIPAIADIHSQDIALDYCVLPTGIWTNRRKLC